MNMNPFKFIKSIIRLNESVNYNQIDPGKVMNKQRSDTSFNFEELLQRANVSTWKLVGSLRKLSNTREAQYNEYTTMAKDVLVSSALELYSDDTVQSDPKTRLNIWVESSDNFELEEDLNLVIKRLGIPDRIWDWAYQISQYGEIYVKLFDDENGNFDYYIEEVQETSKIFDLMKKGKTEYFAVLKEEGSKNTLSLFPPENFVHFYIKKSNRFENMELEIPRPDGTNAIEEFKVARGLSMIDGLRITHRIIRLLEDSLIVSRLNKSALLRIFTIEVGQLPPKKAREMVLKLKRLLDSKEQINLQSGEFVSDKSPGPLDDPLIIPTRNGQGSVSQQTVGGDVDVHSITDVDFFRNKYFAGLKIPKSYLGFEESLPSLGGSSALTQMDVRYSRTIKRIQQSIIAGVTILLNIYLIKNNRSGEINSFQVKMVEPSSKEESDRMTDLQSRISLASSLFDIMIKFESLIDQEAMFKIICKYVLKFNELTQAIRKTDSSTTKDPTQLEDVPSDTPKSTDGMVL